MKNNKRIISIILSIFIFFTFPICSNCKENEINFSQENINQICLTPGENESILNFCWCSTGNSDNQIKIWDKENNEQIFTGISEKINENFYSNKVKIKGLEDNSTYYYSYKLNGIWTKPLEYKTKNSSDFSFALMGDPQIGASSKKINSNEKGIEKDVSSWNKVINQALEKDKNLSFIVCSGDETNTKEDKEDSLKTNISNLEYYGFLSPSKLKEIPLANAIGNHDKSNKKFYNHFYMPNQFDLGQTDAGGDSYFVYGDSLFIFLNTNNLNMKEHKKFIENAVNANKDIKWKIAVFHHDIYGEGIHSKDKDMEKLRDSLPDILEKNKIDLALSGHDHIYSRSYIIKNNKVKTDASKYEISKENRNEEIINNPKGIIYITAGTCTGSKFYEPNNKNNKYSKFKYDKEVPTYTIINVSKDKINIITYESNSNTIIDNKIVITKSE